MKSIFLLIFALWIVVSGLMVQVILANAETIYNGIRPGSGDDKVARRDIGDITINYTDGTTLTSTWR